MTIQAVQFAGALADPEVYGTPGNASASGGVISLPNDGTMTIASHAITASAVLSCFLLKQWSREEVTADGTSDVRQVMQYRVNVFDTGPFHLETIHDDTAHTFKFRLYGDEDPVIQGGDFNVTGTQTFSYGHANKRDILVVLDTDADEWSFYYNSGGGWVQDINGSDARGPQANNTWTTEAGGTNSDAGTETEFAGGAYLSVDDFANFPDAGSDVTFQNTVIGVSSADHADYDKGTAGSAATILTSSVANPTVITTSAAHGFLTGEYVSIVNHTGSTPSINAAHHKIIVTSGTTFTIPVNVTVGGTGGTATRRPPNHRNVDDWESGTHDSVTTIDHMTSAVGQTKLQAYTTATLVPVAGTDVVSLAMFAAQATQSGGKFATGNLFIYDGTDITHSATTAPSTSYSIQRAGFAKAPDGTTEWLDFSWANLELGHRTITDPDEATEYINLTAIYAEIIEIDEPASAAGSTIKPVSIVHM